MSSQHMQDMVPPENNGNDEGVANSNNKRSVRNIPLPEARKRKTDYRNQQPLEKKPPVIPEERSKHSVPRWGVWSVAVISLIIVVFAISTLFASATVVITPKQHSQDVSLSVTAQQNGNGDLRFETISVTEQASESTQSTTTTTVEQKAKGTLTVFNNYSEDPLNLVPNTRFQSEDGQVYRAESGVSIPGMTASEPGQVDVTVIADEAGSDYNLQSGRLTLPGLEGDPAYDDIYATVNDPIDGGATGERYVIPDTEEEQIAQRLREQNENALREKINGEVPDEYVLYQDMVTIEHGSLEQKSGEGSTVILTLTSTGVSPIFQIGDLTNYIIQNTSIEATENDDVEITNINDLTFKPAQSYTRGQDRVSGQLTGHVMLVWKINEDEIKNRVLGESVNSLGNIFAELTEVQEAKAHLQPSWVRTFPTDPNDIEVETTLSEPAEPADS